MKIASAALQMASSHSKQQQHEVNQSLRQRIGERANSEANSQRVAQAAEKPDVQISDSGKAISSNEASAIQDGIDAVENDPMLRLIRAMVAALSGEEVKIFDAREMQLDVPAAAVATPTQTTSSTLEQTAQSDASIEYTRHESYSESEQTSFSAAGVVRTSDGQEINFSLSLSMARSYHEESDTRITIGIARQTKDPLVLNFDGAAAQLTSQRFAFDLDSDGDKENINFVAGGSGFLVFDRNSDGQVNNGSELFGAKSGNGFAELASLDSDKNGWIDESDEAYEKLQVWTKDSSGNDQLTTLKEANVGAISLAHVATPFDVKTSNNELQGQIRSSGIFLQENGQAGTLQQIDLTV